MSLTRFDHINLLTADIDAMRDFLGSVLDVKPGRRPAFRSPGYWLYHGEIAIFHISDARNHEQTHADDVGAVQTSGEHGVVDHVAFRCDGYRAMIDRLHALGVLYHEADLPYAPDRQVFVDGPVGFTLELLFTHTDVLAGGGRILADGVRA
jgi:catechol 2,3-dioxygenase-like lactoylglutathione lyase family enzyme